MRARPRDFIHTKDDLFFATTTYLHPEDRILSFLRYIPDPDGDRSLNGKRYSKVDSKQAYEFLSQKFPDYLFDCDVTKVQMMGVPIERVETVLHPEERLNEILNLEDPDELLNKVIKVADTFHEHAGIPYDKMGISGSTLPGLYKTAQSDVDFVVYGLQNHRKAMKAFEEIKKDENGALKGIGPDYWRKLYEKRIKDGSLSYEEFMWYENRKHNRGVVDGSLFDILATRDWDEIHGSYADTTFEPMGTLEVECTVKDALAAFDNPSVYEVEDVKILNGPDVPLDEVASFTHTYAGQAVEGERILARGKLERFTGPKSGYRIVVGTTRESIGEYIKLKDLKI